MSSNQTANEKPKLALAEQHYGRHMAHAERWGTTKGVAAYAWSVLDVDKRAAMAAHVAKELRWPELTGKAFVELAKTENFDSQHPTFRYGVVYLALCYSHISGRYDINQFAANYKEANSF